VRHLPGTPLTVAVWTARRQGTSGLARRWTFYIGADGRILDIDKEVRAASHGTDIVKRLEELRVQR